MDPEIKIIKTNDNQIENQEKLHQEIDQVIGENNKRNYLVFILFIFLFIVFLLFTLFFRN